MYEYEVIFERGSTFIFADSCFCDNDSPLYFIIDGEIIVGFCKWLGFKRIGERGK